MSKMRYSIREWWQGSVREIEDDDGSIYTHRTGRPALIHGLAILLIAVLFYGSIVGGCYLYIQKENSIQENRTLGLIETGWYSKTWPFTDSENGNEYLKDLLNSENRKARWLAYYRYLQKKPDVLKEQIAAGFIDEEKMRKALQES